MTIFTLLPIAERNLLAGALFFVTVGLLAVLLFQFLTHARLWRSIVNTILFLIFTGFTAYVMASATKPEIYPLPVAWVWLLIVAVIVLCYDVLAIATEYGRNKKQLSSASVKETLDNLASGICFADKSGRIILINVAMSKLTSALIGSYPQMLWELLSSLEQPSAESGVEKLDGSLYRFPDGKVWRFNTVSLQGEELNGFTQTTAQDVTEIYETTAKLKEDNEELHVTIKEILKLYDRLSDRVREQETLALKIRVHNESGENLLAISQMIDTGETDNVEDRLKNLQHALWHFAGTGNSARDTFDEAEQQAKTMGISLTLDGSIPMSARVEKIIVLACRECVTNCKKHAKGSAVNVKITNRDHFYTVSITNDGEKPKDEIKEGGGLTSLRQTVENAGGEMHVSHKPHFALIIDLPKEDKNT